MKKNISKLLFLKILILFSCTEKNMSNNVEVTNLQKVDSLLNANIYPSTSNCSKDSILEINMKIPELEFFREEKLTIIRKVAIAEIYSQISNVKGIMFIFYNPKHIGEPKYYRKTFLPKQSIEWIDKVIIHDPTRYDFMLYTFKNIRGMEFVDYHSLCKGVFEWEADKTLKDTEYPNFTEVIEKYSLECQGIIKDDYYKNTLLKMKKLYSENKDLFPDLKIEKLDYFLSYCDKK